MCVFERRKPYSNCNTVVYQLADICEVYVGVCGSGQVSFYTHLVWLSNGQPVTHHLSSPSAVNHHHKPIQVCGKFLDVTRWSGPQNKPI